MNGEKQEIDKYPWLSKYFSSEVRSLRKKISDKALPTFSELKVMDTIDMEMKPKRINFLNMVSPFIWGEEDEYEEILLLDANGEKLLRVGEFQRLSNSILWRWFTPEVYIVFNPNETVGEAIVRTKKKKVSYVLDVISRTLYAME
jgi:hypothetical protein